MLMCGLNLVMKQANKQTNKQTNTQTSSMRLSLDDLSNRSSLYSKKHTKITAGWLVLFKKRELRCLFLCCTHMTILAWTTSAQQLQYISKKKSYLHYTQSSIPHTHSHTHTHTHTQHSKRSIVGTSTQPCHAHYCLMLHAY